MVNTVKWHLANLTRFSGREARGVFWPYAGLVVLFQIVLGWVLMIPVSAVLFSNMQDFIRIQEEQMAMGADSGAAARTAEQVQAHLMPLYGWIMLLSGILLVVVIALLAAAVTRRLHDSGRSGIWGLLPLPFLVISNLLMMRLFSGGMAEPDANIAFLMFGLNGLYLILLVLLIVWLATAGTSQDNRYGPVPAAHV